MTLTGMNLALAVVSVFFLIATRVYACVWSYGTSLEGKQITVADASGPQLALNLMTHESREEWNEERIRLEDEFETEANYQTRNDLAVALIHLGQLKRATAILESIEKQHPGEYVTAANLGTAYELSGRNEKALRWIKEGIRRNSESHNGTEWLHVKILEAKLAIEKEPDWLKTHSVLGVGFGTEEVPRMPEHLPADHLGRSLSVEQIEKALAYQLDERLEFTERPDALVADLLFDLGNVLALTKTAEHAKAVYELSLAYNPTHEDIVRSRLD